MPGSDLKSSLQYPNGLTASWTYDANNQLLQVRNATPTNVISQFDYTYDAAGRRVSIAKSGTAFGDLSGSIDSYTYNDRSELTSARRTKNGQPIPGFSEDFDYDPIGNRRSSATYNEKGEVQTSTYVANNLNQYTTRTTPGYAAVRGEADPNATVTVNENPTFRFGSYYFGSDLFDNTSDSGLANLETYAVSREETVGGGGEEEGDLVSATTNQVYIAQSPEAFAYDDDGNQTLITTKTGLWRITYNGENRPIRWMRDSDNTTLTMSYDHMGRRRQKNDQRFFYDGYLQIADNSGNANTWDCTEPIATRPLVWNNSSPLISNSSFYYTHDGNKNVSEVIASECTTSAHYEYTSFGSVHSQFGTLAKANSFRFSSEFADDRFALICYMRRFYHPDFGCWLHRDPIEENGGMNLYATCNNNLLNVFDVIGLWSSTIASYGEKRRVYKKDGKDTIKGLADELGLDDWAFHLWARVETDDKASEDNPGKSAPSSDAALKDVCYISVPNVWIEADLLRDGGIYDRVVVNHGGTIGSFFGQTLGRWGYHTLKPGTPGDLLKTVKANIKNIYGLTVYAHGSPNGYIVSPDRKSAIHQTKLMAEFRSNGYRIAQANMMQCYSIKTDGVIPTGPKTEMEYNYKDAWEKTAVKVYGYEGVNVIGIDFN